MTKISWRTKGQQSSIHAKKCTIPGEYVSVDQLKSSTPGFNAELKGRLTKDRYICDTIYVDHASR